MKDIEKIRKRLQDDISFKNKFVKVRNEDEAIELAKKLGYEIEKEDIENDKELNEDLMEAVSGGKNSKKVKIYTCAESKGSKIHIGDIEDT